jgi:hypothetical protein
MRGETLRWTQTEQAICPRAELLQYQELQVNQQISKSTPDPPWQRNPKIVTQLQFLIAGVVTAILIGLFLWLTGWP